MGDRISISFKNGNEESVTLFSHWGGRSFLDQALEYLKVLREERKEKALSPLDRFEVNTVMMDFIRHITKGVNRIESNYYLGKDASQGDNSDNGHFVINVQTGDLN